MQRTAAAIVGDKGAEVWFVLPDDTVYHALEAMAEKNVGSMLVLEDGRLVGIVSERDYARKVILVDKASKETLVAEIMTTTLITVEPSCTVTDAMSLMTDERVRHLPVLDDGELVGVISIGDVVKAVMADQLEMIDQLEQYITG
jgi:CBS domain-containing protein